MRQPVVPLDDREVVDEGGESHERDNSNQMDMHGGIGTRGMESGQQGFGDAYIGSSQAQQAARSSENSSGPCSDTRETMT